MSTLKKLYHIVIPIVLLVISTTASVPASRAAPTVANAIPAPISGLPKPTIRVTPDHGYIGQQIDVSGQGVATAPGVRLVWLYGDATRTAVVVDNDSSNTYHASLSIPPDAQSGAGQICAAATGTSQAEFACAPFGIEEPPPGGVSGQLPTSTSASARASTQDVAFNASFNLLNVAGETVASAPIQSNGAFNLESVAPGSYDFAVVGQVPAPVSSGQVLVDAGHINNIHFRDTLCNGSILSTNIASVSATPSTRVIPVGSVVPSYNFGTYVSGVALNVTLAASVQQLPNTHVDGVDFQIIAPGRVLPVWSDSSRTPDPSGKNGPSA